MSNQTYGRNFLHRYGLQGTGQRIMLTSLGDAASDELLYQEQLKTMRTSRIVGIVTGIASVGSLLFAIAAFARKR